MGSDFTSSLGPITYDLSEVLSAMVATTDISDPHALDLFDLGPEEPMDGDESALAAAVPRTSVQVTCSKLL